MVVHVCVCVCVRQVLGTQRSHAQGLSVDAIVRWHDGGHRVLRMAPEFGPQLGNAYVWGDVGELVRGWGWGWGRRCVCVWLRRVLVWDGVGKALRLGWAPLVVASIGVGGGGAEGQSVVWSCVCRACVCVHPLAGVRMPLSWTRAALFLP